MSFAVFIARRFASAVCAMALCPSSHSAVSGAPGTLDSDVYWPAQLCCVWPQELEPTTSGPAITRTVALFIQAPAQDPPVPALDSAGCSCGCRVPTSGAVVTVQRVRRRLQISRLDSTCTQARPHTSLAFSDACRMIKHSHSSDLRLVHSTCGELN